MIFALFQIYLTPISRTQNFFFLLSTSIAIYIHLSQVILRKFLNVLLKTSGSFPPRRVTTLAPVYIPYSIALMGFQLINDFPTRTLKSFPQRYSPSHSELLSCPVFLWELVYPGCKIDVFHKSPVSQLLQTVKSLNSSPALKHIAWCFNTVSSANLMRECISLTPPCH